MSCGERVRESKLTRLIFTEQGMKSTTKLKIGRLNSDEMIKFNQGVDHK
jgi:hypothetical protein